jgi:hypothetical protein
MDADLGRTVFRRLYPLGITYSPLSVGSCTNTSSSFVPFALRYGVISA